MTLIRAFLNVFSGFLYFLINALNKVITTIVLSIISGYVTHTGSEGNLDMIWLIISVAFLFSSISINCAQCKFRKGRPIWISFIPAHTHLQFEIVIDMVIEVLKDRDATASFHSAPTMCSDILWLESLVITVVTEKKFPD